MPPVSISQIVNLLVEAGYSNRTAADEAPDGDVARLLASISAAQFAAAVRISGLAGVELPALPVAARLLEFPFQFYFPGTNAPGAVVFDPGVAVRAADLGDGVGSGGVSSDVGVSSDDEGSTDTEGVTTDGISEDDSLESAGRATASAPSGLTVQEFSALVAAEDAARYAFEVTAARSADAERAQLRALAHHHATRANAWVGIGQLAGTAQDPRQVAWALPPAASPPELVLLIESDLAERYAALVARAAPGTRLGLIDGLIEANVVREHWGGAPLVFPGAPDIATALGVSPPPPDVPALPHATAPALVE
jgi:hypothetical protein